MTTFSTLRALHAVIGQALDDIEKVYKANSADKPLDYPSLDIPYYSVEKNPPEIEKAEELRTEPTAFAAANQIVAACGQLTATVHKPFFSLVESVQVGGLVACLHFLEATHLVEILREAGPDGLSVKDISLKIKDVSRDAVDVEPSKISHILRLLATYHWLREVKPDVFANNRLSSFIDSGKSITELRESPEKKYDETDGVAAFTALGNGDLLQTQTALTDWLLLGGGKPGSEYRTPFNLAYKTPLNYYEWLEQPGNESRLTRFGHAMNGTRYWELAENIVHGFQWSELPRDSVVVDIGGGIGSVSVMLAQAYPHLRFVVEDRAAVVSLAPTSWGDKHADLFSSGRVSFHPQNFFEPRSTFDVPGVGTITAPAVFLLRAVAHNWPDENVRELLTHLRHVAGPDTKLLLVDNLLAYTCKDEEGEGENGNTALRSLIPEGSPLLPNLGRASANGYLLDISMMSTLDAKERTYHEMDELTRSAGWKIERVKRAIGSLWAYTTAVPI